MGWPEALAELVTILEGVSIDEPDAPGHTMTAQVFDRPRTSLEASEVPCFIISEPEQPDEPTVMNDWRADELVVAAGLFVRHDASNPRRAGLAMDRFMEALRDAMDGAQQLHGAAVICRGPRILPANAELFAGITYPHTRFEFRIRLEKAVTVGA